MDCLEIDRVSRKYVGSDGEKFSALKDVSLTWEKGKSIAVMGESGSGKSTLARLMIGMERPDAGEIRIDGQDTTHWGSRRWRQERSQIQAVFQDAGGTLNPSRSAYHNVEEALCNLTSLSRTERKERILDLMELTELKAELLSVPVQKLSGGEQRRMALLRSLAIRPAFFVLDEVTAGLDLISTEAVMRVLENYQKQYGCTYFLITHDSFTASRLCNTVYEIEAGSITRVAVKDQQNSRKES